MLIVSDVHGAVEPLRRVASLGEPLLVLGDLINYIDYRSNEGIVADISGKRLVDEFVRIRAVEGSEAATEFWHGEWAHRDAGLEARYTEAVEASYRDVCGALTGSRAYVTYGNVDRPGMLAEHLPDGV
ncbi:MAG: metallophosphoesterase, partial [Phycisphaeraceae bacterium]|nr:metallophosphoesterase [Phycisphaeraceae bacterium]